MKLFGKKVAGIAGCMLMFALSVGAAAQPASKIVVGVPSLGGERLDYTRPSGTTNGEIRRVLSRELVEFGPNGEYVPGIAQSWKMSADGKTWDLFLRKGVKWHNGDTLTSADVLAGVERMKRPEISAGQFVSGLLDNLSAMEAVDDYHVRYHFKTAFPLFPYFVNMALPVPKKYIEQVGDAAFSDKPVGMGPFKFVRGVKGAEYEFEAFDGYFGKVPPFKTLVLKIMPENATRLAALKTGEIDMAKDIQGKMLLEVKKTPGLSVTTTPSGASSYLNFSHRYEKDSPWADPRVRRAVALAIDRATIAKTIFQGEAVPSAFPDCSFCFGMPKDLKPWPYDPVKAKALLAEAGYAQGVPGEWDMQTQISGSAPMQPEVTQAVAGYLSKIGIKTKFQVIEGGAFATAYKAKKLKGLPVKASGETRFDVGLKTDVWAARAESWSMLKDDDTNKLWDEQLETADPQKRREMLETAVKTIVEDVRLVPLVEINTVYALGPKIKEYKLRKGQVWITDQLENIVLK